MVWIVKACLGQAFGAWFLLLVAYRFGWFAALLFFTAAYLYAFGKYAKA